MKILITGGSGMLGQALINDPLFQNDEFIILTRKPSRSLRNQHVMYQYWNPDALDGWQEILENQDVIIHLAGHNIGEGYWSARKKQLILNSRVNSGKILAEAIMNLSAPPSIFIQASAVGYYGSRANEVLTEDSEKGDGFLSDVCEAWETSTAVLESAGIRRLILRTGVILSSTAGMLPKLNLPIKAFIGGNLGNGKQYIPWLHMDDFSAIVNALIQKKETRGIYNLCAPKAATFSEMGKSIAKNLNRPYWLPVPGFALRLLLGEMSTLLLASQRVKPERLLEINYEYRYRELRDALKSFV
ncbi:MAG: TIGR01777 family oxidoreductase [Anaerolineaceae bacterium]|nr:TIGR01777 family oxidoreductase [Anaerolineaceae bacterium]